MVLYGTVGAAIERQVSVLQDRTGATINGSPADRPVLGLVFQKTVVSGRSDRQVVGLGADKAFWIPFSKPTLRPAIVAKVFENPLSGNLSRGASIASTGSYDCKRRQIGPVRMKQTFAALSQTS